MNQDDRNPSPGGPGVPSGEYSLGEPSREDLNGRPLAAYPGGEPSNWGDGLVLPTISARQELDFVGLTL